MLLASGDAPDQTFLAQPLLDGVLDAAHDFLAVAARLANRLGDHAVTPGIHRGETKILQFQTHTVHA